MTRLCVIGNSHIAAVRNAWRNVGKDYPGLEAEFYAQHNSQIVNAILNSRGEITVEGSPFWHFKEGSDDVRANAIPWRDFDAVVLVGLAFGPGSVVRLYRKYHYFGLKGRRPQALTRENFRKAAWASANESSALHLVNLLGQEPRRPLFVVPTPLPSERGYDDAEKPGMIAWRAAAAAGDTEALLEIYDEICAGIAEKGAIILGQPPGTKVSNRCTFQKFADNATRVHNEGIRPDNDYVHMNDEYGALVWREIANALTSAGLGAR
jgi:hypothetical protein